MIARFFGYDLYTEGDYACHGDEVNLMFKTHGIPLEGSYSNSDVAVTKILLKTWTNFIKFGNPNGDFEYFKWEKLDKSNPKYLEINTEPRMVSYEESGRLEKMQFWRNFFINHRPYWDNNKRAASSKRNSDKEKSHKDEL